MFDGGRFLQFCVNVLSAELNKYRERKRQRDERRTEDLVDEHVEDVAGASDFVDGIIEEIEEALRQCFYCLFHHPPRKPKVKSTSQDHSTNSLSLTWSNCKRLYDFFKPRELPEFDGYKTDTISADIESLFRRILAVAPTSYTADSITDGLKRFIQRVVGEFQPIKANAEDSIVLKDIFYLLADYNFKTRELEKAMLFYMKDLCFNSKRFDSWAGMALASSSKLENRLNSCDDDDSGSTSFQVVSKQARSVLKCFEEAVEIEQSNITLWIEYGLVAYQFHSHASRELKKVVKPLDESTKPSVDKCRDEMLEIARKAYLAASSKGNEGDVEAANEEEEWLQHYMLGKTTEKRRRGDSRVFLEHYKQAAIHLHNDNAKYPKKIGYSPPTYSLEALEVFFRLNASALKVLLRDCPNYEELTILENYVAESAKSPFASGVEKKQELKLLKAAEKEKETAALSAAASAINAAPTDVNEDHHRKRSHEEIMLDAQPAKKTKEDGTTTSSAFQSTPSSIPQAAALFSSIPQGAVTLASSKEKSGDEDVMIIESDDSRSQRDLEVRRHRLVEKCRAAMHLCLSRYSTHYKAIYRLAHLYYSYKPMKDMQVILTPCSGKCISVIED